MDELKDRLNKQIARRNREVRVVGFASKRTTDMISKTRLLIKLNK